MTVKELQRLETFNESIEKGKRFFIQLQKYYESEEILNFEDFIIIKENIVKINYLNKPYILELTHNEDLNLGQIIVYESEIGTHFMPEPKFKRKEKSLIYYDYPGNIFIGNDKATHLNPSKSAESIIREVTKDNI